MSDAGLFKKRPWPRKNRGSRQTSKRHTSVKKQAFVKNSALAFGKRGLKTNDLAKHGVNLVLGAGWADEGLGVITSGIVPLLGHGLAEKGSQQTLRAQTVFAPIPHGFCTLLSRFY